MIRAFLLLLALCVPSLSYAAWGTGSGACTAQSKSAGTSLACTVSTQDIEAGNVAMVWFGGDNTATTDGNSGLVTAVSDSKSNTWKIAQCYTNGNGSAGTGATTCMAYSVLTATLVSATDTITVTHASITARAMVTKEYTTGVGATVFAHGSATLPGNLANDAADPGSLTLSGVMSAEHLFVRATRLVAQRLKAQHFQAQPQLKQLNASSAGTSDDGTNDDVADS